jgi:5-(carboxyamino)imidazole ribonucleotide mutase
MAETKPLVAVLMGSKSDWEVMRQASETLTRFEVPHECRVVSAHRTPDWMREYSITARDRGLRLIIAGAGGAAHLPGMVAAYTALPVLGVPLPSSGLAGIDSLLSILQMPRGVPVATLGVGEWGATNAALFAVRMLAVGNPELSGRLTAYGKQNEDQVRKESLS